jgi:hypothetical protein
MKLTIEFIDDDRDDETHPISDSILQEGFLVYILPEGDVCGVPLTQVKSFRIHNNEAG